MRAAAPGLHDGLGSPIRKVPAVLSALTGVPLTPGALTPEALRRTAGPVGPAYEPWRAVGPVAPVVHTADTGWRVGGESAVRMAFETEAATVSQVRPRPRPEAVQEVIPADDSGVRVTERGRSDEAQAFNDVRQPQCLAHVQRSLSEVLAATTGRARDFGARLTGWLRDARPWWHADHGTVTDFAPEAKARREELTSQRRDRPRKDPDQQRRLNELGWHHDRGTLGRFLDDPRIEPTNNRAERALRPAVIARKVSQGSKNGRGAHAVAAFTSVVRTLANNGTVSRVDGLYHLCRSPNLDTAPP